MIKNGSQTMNTYTHASNQNLNTAVSTQNYLIGNNSPSPVLTMNAIESSLTVNGDIVVNGLSITERLERIEYILHIPSRDQEMEEKYPKLKKLWEEYNRELSKYRTWEKLKK
jgi:hypothetical protein